jgi:hypothetical protein
VIGSWCIIACRGFRNRRWISLCAACHAIVERLQAVRIWMPPQLLILWREQHRDLAYQLPLPIEPQQSVGGPALFHARSNHAQFNPKVVELDV